MLSTLARAKYLDKLEGAMQQLGSRHSDYGVTPFQIMPVKNALLDSLEHFLADKFTSDTRQAWEDFFDAIAEMMQQGMEQSVTNDNIPHKNSPSYSDATLLEDIGGEEIIRQIHERFYDWIMQDAWLGKFFWAKSKESLVQHQTEFMVSCFGGANHFKGETPAIAHMHMVITDEMYDLRQYHLKRCILEQGLSEEIADRWIAVDNAFRKAMIRTNSNQCVMRCIGQMPIEFEKPANYPWPIKS